MGQARFSRRRRGGEALAVAPFLVLAPFLPQLPQPGDRTPHIEPASDEALEAMDRFEIPAGFELQLFAAEPRIAHPVCLEVDPNGDVYLAESFRFSAGATNLLAHPDWVEHDARVGDVADRRAMMERVTGKSFDRYALASERVHWLRDTDGDGRADVDTVFAEGFASHVTGVGAGLLRHGRDLYYACVPDLWLLRDTDGTRRADSRTLLSTGYGVKVGFGGHGVHGLCIGPDGKLYFSCGDRGFDVETETGRLSHPETGAVLRCNLDGTGLEVYATGLRNPQELVFDEYGNLFTADNNADGGDLARLVHVVEGSDSGWRYAYQWLSEPRPRGPWNEERLWYLHHDGQAAYILPPIAHLAVGPSGLAYDPGTGLPPEYARHFFLCDYANDPQQSGIHTFTLEPQGAGFRMSSSAPFVWGLLATDCVFAPDGTLYFSDWVEDLDQHGKGRVYRLRAPGATSAETAALLREGVRGRETGELVALLSHLDRRVRQGAQLELVRRGARDALARTAVGSAPRLARVHAVWGLRMLPEPSPLPLLLPLLEDGDAELRAQVARAVGDLPLRAAEVDAVGSALIARLADESPRVRLFAAIAVGKVGPAEATEPLLELLRSPGAGDPALRHAAVMGLVGCAAPEELEALRGEPVDVRLGAVVALRRMGDVRVAAFLRDADQRVVLEAARAIHDVPIPAARAQLAALIRSADPLDQPLGRRVVQACFRARDEAAARALLEFALQPGQDERLRAEAVERVASWSRPAGRDPVTGAWRPLAPDDGAFLPGLVEELLREPGLEAIGAAPPAVLEAWMRLVTEARSPSAEDLLEAVALDAAQPHGVAIAALESLGALESQRLPQIIERILAERGPRVRATSLQLLASISPQAALPLLERAATEGGAAERRVAYKQLCRVDPARAEEVLASELARLEAGELPEELALDLVLAAESLDSEPLGRALAARRNAHTEASPQVEAFLDCLSGGAVPRGRKTYVLRADLECMRCHGDPAGEADTAGKLVGPDLRGLGQRATRLELLESIVAPNQRIADGFGGYRFWLNDGTIVAGRVLEETDGVVRVMDVEGQVLELAADEIETRRASLSAMPEGYDGLLTRTQMRDLIEYLSSL